VAGYERGIDLYINQKDGTFKNEGAALGLTMNEFLKGVVATDVNDDKYPDLFISGLTDGNHLFINHMKDNQGFQLMDGLVRNPKRSFPCWNFDYDNDGDEDLFVSAFSNETNLTQYWMKSKMGKPDPEFLPKIYENKGNLQFEDVGLKLGLNEDVFTMGCNFGDINTDGFLDFYLATGNPLYQSLVPNIMYLNMDGKRFEDVSYSGGFANIQKGHAVGFGDIDHDGDEDIYVKIGGGYDGDGFYNTLFENPNEHQNNWIVLKLAGQTANKAAIGARVAISVQEGGKERKIYRTVTAGASFGANSLALEVGLRKATTVNSVTIQWPCKDCPDQVFNGMDINHAYVLTQDQPQPVPMEYQKVEHMDMMHHEHH
jgi:FG-GAP-like repeat/ASPIC and UnbV